jgi:glutamate-5-semialdehyde dehydrogenase
MAGMVVSEIARQARLISRQVGQSSAEKRSGALKLMAENLWSHRSEIIGVNNLDVEDGKKNGLNAALIDRLTITESRMKGIVDDLTRVSELPDPVGEVFEDFILPNGLHIQKIRVPLGVLGVIYESRPNVTVDISGLALKSGNCAVLRGGSETVRSNRALVKVIRESLGESGLPADAIQFLDSPDRSLVMDLLQQDQYIDMIIPRGGAGLHDFCRKNSRIPVITGGIGICHLFVDESADLDAAIPVIENAKVQRPSVCNALDTALIHRSVASKILPVLVERLSREGVTFRADPHAYAILEGHAGVYPAGETDFDTEWLSLVLGLKVVDSLEEAIEHIAMHSTAHSDGILTNDLSRAEEFVKRVDSAAVYVNASTRFTDGAQMGLGAEVAVSTQRLHARGPMGLRELTTFKWVIKGNYHIRPS